MGAHVSSVIQVPTIAPELRIRAKPKAWGKLKRKPVRLRENTSDTPEAINRRVFALTQVFASLGALKPEGMMTSRLQREWEQSCQRLSQQLVTNAETITIQNAIQTATELNSFMEARGRGGTPCHVDLDAYLHCKEATTAPCRALNSLRWLCKHGQLGWDVSSLVAPTSRSRKADKTQALVVLPPMFPFLEERVEQLWQVQDVRWSSLLASWIVHLAEAVSTPEEMKSYSWRRMPSTAAYTMGLSPLDLSALGDWVNKRDLPQESKMPMHYSGARYGQSLRVKHMVLRAMEVLSQYETWELIPQEAIDDAKEKGRAAADKATQQDNTVLWALPLEPHEVRERFELTTALKSRAQKRKAEAMEPSSEGVMPDEIQGRITTAFLKNGMPLCSAFQMKSCPADGTTCTKLHKCAVVLRTGRACGGSHPACECRDKRAVKAE
eukprot:symbB.v1.2.037638.t1/scaffold5613.1/size25359/1